MGTIIPHMKYYSNGCLLVHLGAKVSYINGLGLRVLGPLGWLTELMDAGLGVSSSWVF